MWTSKSDESSEKQAKLQQFAKQLRLQILFVKTQCYLQLKAMKACKREQKAIAAITTQNEQTKTPHTANEVLIINFLKSKFEFQVRCLF